MNIIELAKKACAPNQTFNSDPEWVERFFNLAFAAGAAHERNKYLDKLAEAIDISVKAEREACAKVCLQTGIKHPQQTGQEACAAAIRARGEK